MSQGIFGEPHACKNLAKFLETIFENWINEHMQPHEPLKACGEANKCIIFQKMKKTGIITVLRQYQLHTVKHLRNQYVIRKTM